MELMSGGDFGASALTWTPTLIQQVQDFSSALVTGGLVRAATEARHDRLRGADLTTNLGISHAELGKLAEGRLDVFDVHGSQSNTRSYPRQCAIVFDAPDTRSYVSGMDSREVLRALMDSHGHNAYDLERISGVPQPTIHRFLSGKHGDPRSSTLKKLADAYGVTESQLRGDVPIEKMSTTAADANASGAKDPSAALLADWQALPEGWRYYICRKTKELRDIAEELPEFMKKALREIPDDASYWKWEREIADFVYQRNGIVQDDGYIGPNRRARDVGHEPNRRQFGLEGDTGGKSRQNVMPRAKRGAT